jgi:hypothetical protein
VCVTCSTSSGEWGLLVAAEVLVLPVCKGPEVVPPITLDVPAGGVLLLEAPVWACLRGACIGFSICRFPLWALAVRCETTSASRDGCRKVRKTYIFASRCKDVHEGNPGSTRSIVLGRGRARKETTHHVLDSGPFSMARGGSSAVVASRIKLPKDDETCIESTVSYELTSSKNLLVCIGARLGRGCTLGMIFCRSHVRDRTN